MSHSTQQARLRAETLAWPLWSEPAYEKVTVALGRLHHGVPDDSTSALAKALDAWLAPRMPGTSLDELASLRSELWLGHEDAVVSLERYLIDIASDLLECSGPRVRLRERVDSNLMHLLERWHWLARAMPTDLLVAACACHEGVSPIEERVNLLGYELDPLLQDKVAETHLHVGAAVSFPRLWSGLMARGHELDPRNRKLTRGGPLPFGEPDTFVTHILAAAVARLTMAVFLRWRSDKGSGDMSAFLGPPATQLARRARWPFGDGGPYRGWLALLHALTQAGPFASLATVQRLWRALSTAATRTDSAHQSGHAPVMATTELDLAHQALVYLCGAGVAKESDDPLFRKLFWQYQRIRGQTFRHLVHAPGTTGLDWFSNHYARISALRAPLGAGKYRQALEHQSQGLGLESLEVRTSPETKWHDNVREIRALAEQARAWQQKTDRSCEVGLVLHFIKQRDCACKRHHQDPTHPAYGMRCGVWYQAARKRVNALSTVLQKRPESLFLLRGIDVANVEMALPTWTTVPLFHQMRRAACRASHTLARRFPDIRFEPLRTTYHAGEEFRCIGEGLRRIHELLESEILCRRSRIGHGLALGMDVQRCQAQNQPAEERLDDLLWEWDRYARGQLAPEPASRLEVIKQQIRSLAKKIYTPPVAESLLTVPILSAARRLRLQPAELERLGYPIRTTSQSPPPDGARRLLWLYLTDPGVFQRGQERVSPPTDDTATKALARLQRWLRECLTQKNITVEANPSSNLAIGQIATLNEHPMFTLQPPAETAATGLPVSINTDNPLTFSTCLRDEYAYIQAALQQRGLSPRQAKNWLTQARDAGWYSRFTLPETRQSKFLDMVIKQLSARAAH